MKKNNKIIKRSILVVLIIMMMMVFLSQSVFANDDSYTSIWYRTYSKTNHFNHDGGWLCLSGFNRGFTGLTAELSEPNTGKVIQTLYLGSKKSGHVNYSTYVPKGIYKIYIYQNNWWLMDGSGGFWVE